MAINMQAGKKVFCAFLLLGYCITAGESSMARVTDLEGQAVVLNDTGKTQDQTSGSDASLQLPPPLQLKEATSYTWMASAQHPDGSAFSSASDFSLASADLRRQVEALRPAANLAFSERVAFAA